MILVDMRIIVDDYFPKLAVVHRRSNSLPSPSFAIIDAPSRNSSFSYTKLPEEPLKLSILKLDGSCFDIEVMRRATIAELRQAVENAFSHMPQKGPGKISWPHVWSHFCLTYDGRKLLTDADYIRNYGIKDDDQLQFIRHISNCFNLKKKRSTKRFAASEQHEIWPSLPDIYEEKGHNDREINSYDVENGVHNCYDDKDNIFEKKETRLTASFHFHRWLAYSRLATMERSLKGYPARSAYGILGNFKKVIQLCGDRYYSKRNHWRED